MFFFFFQQEERKQRAEYFVFPEIFNIHSCGMKNSEQKIGVFRDL